MHTKEGVSYLLLWILSGFLIPQQQQEPVKEHVSVVNVIVLARVLKDGKPVGGLQRKDFTLQENGREMDINGFREVRRRITTRQVALTDETGQKQRENKRFFLLYFWLNNPEVNVQKVLDSFFETIYQEKDGVILAADRTLLSIRSKDEIPAIRSQFLEKVAQSTRAQKNEMDIMANRFEQRAEWLKSILRMPPSQRPPNYMQEFTNDLSSSWTEFKYKQLRTNVGFALQLAQGLKPIPGDKWALIFYQPRQFPILRSDNDLKTSAFYREDIEMIDKLRDQTFLAATKPEMNVAIMKDIQQAFINANATFHVLQPPAEGREQMISSFWEMHTVYSDWEEVFKSISRATGGAVVADNQLHEALSRALEREDIYYELSYAPTAVPSKKRTIDIRVRDRKLEVYHLQRVTTQEPEEIAIDRFSFVEPQIQFDLRGYQFTYEKEQVQGRVKITVTAIDEEGKHTSYTKEFSLLEPEMTISMNLHFPHPGKYELVIDALDLVNGKQHVLTRTLQVSAKPPTEDQKQ